MKVCSTKGDVVGLTRRAGECVEVNVVVAIGDERRRSIVVRAIGNRIAAAGSKIENFDFGYADSGCLMSH